MLAVGGFELADELVAALDDGIERLLSVLGAGQQLLELLVDDITDLHVIAKAQALGILGRRIERDLLDRDIRTGVGLVEALALAELIGGRGDRQVAGELVPAGLHLGRAQVREEVGYALIFLGLVALQDPERGAT